MITEVKMKVNEDHSKRVQEIVLGNGGSWSGGNEIKHTDASYLYINYNKELTFGIDQNCYEEDSFKEVAAYDFISSNGACNHHKHKCTNSTKKISFDEFLKDNDCYEQYMNNIKIENQRWDSIKYYKTFENIKKQPSNNWITGAFDFSKQAESYNYWLSIAIEWAELYNENEVEWV